MTRLLYALAIPRASETGSRPTSRQNVAALAALEQDTGGVEVSSTDPVELSIEGQFRGKFAALMAREVEELFAGSGIETVPFFDRDEVSRIDGYYALEAVETPPVDPRSDAAYEFRGGRARKIGSRRTHYRSVQINTQTRDNPFGNDSTNTVALPAAATSVRWWDAVNRTIASATVQSTDTGERVDTETYDVTEPSFSSNDKVYLVYDVPYSEEHPADVRVWDDHDRAKEYTEGGPTVGTAVVGSASLNDRDVAAAWQRVFRTDHEYHGIPILENGLHRLDLDNDAGEIRAYSWDTGVSDWSRTTLGQAEWRLKTVDLRRIGTERVNGTLRFDDISSLRPDQDYALSLSFKRGYSDPLFFVPSSPQAASELIVDDFEDENVGEYDGYTGGASVVTTDNKTGDASLELPSDGPSQSIASTSGLAHYPQENETWQCWVKIVDADEQAEVGWFAQAESADPNGYYAVIDDSNEQIEIQEKGGGGTLTTGSQTIPTGSWLLIEISHDDTSSDNITLDYYGTNDSVQTSITATGTDYDSGGVAITSTGSGGTVRYDSYRIISPNADHVPQGLIDRLNPIAATTDQDPDAVAGVRKRSEVDP